MSISFSNSVANRNSKPYTIWLHAFTFQTVKDCGTGVPKSGPQRNLLRFALKTEIRPAAHDMTSYREPKILTKSAHRMARAGADKNLFSFFSVFTKLLPHEIPLWAKKFLSVIWVFVVLTSQHATSLGANLTLHPKSLGTPLVELQFDARF